MLDLQNQSKSAPAIRLESIAGDLPVEIANFDGGIVTLGREPENSIVVDSVSVSRRHGCIAQAGSQWIYRDLDSTNGSWVNGVQVFPGQVRLLRHGDVIQFADFPVRVSLSDTSDTAEESRSLLVFFGDRFEAEVFLGEAQARFVIGGPDASMHVDGESPDDVQLEVINIGNRLELCTGNCSNPIIVNGLAVGG
ncbi:MAG: FHA domain-containing protein, partial [Bdellovibrionales bacterium]|nr:FHA domain-containing protein [Bdellovibrionales bacterium]